MKRNALFERLMRLALTNKVSMIKPCEYSYIFIFRSRIWAFKYKDNMLSEESTHFIRDPKQYDALYEISETRQ